MVQQTQFGRGIICPFQRDGKGDFANSDGMSLLKSDIRELIGLVGSSVNDPGELPWDPDRGSRISSLRHRHLHAEMTRALAEQYTATPLRVYENRIRTGPAKIDTSDGKLNISISFTPKTTQTGEMETVSVYEGTTT